MLLTTNEDSSCEQSARWATSVSARLWGLHACDGFGGVLVLAPCKSIHTFGMRRPIDVALVSRMGVVLKAFVNLPHNKVVRHKQAAVALERFSSSEPWYVPGELIDLGKLGQRSGCHGE